MNRLLKEACKELTNAQELLDNTMGIVRSLGFNYILKGCLLQLYFMCHVMLEHSLITGIEYD